MPHIRNDLQTIKRGKNVILSNRMYIAQRFRTNEKSKSTISHLAIQISNAHCKY